MQINCISIKWFEVINHTSFLGFRRRCRQLTVTKTSRRRLKKGIYCVANRKKTGCILAKGGLRRTLRLGSGAAFFEGRGRRALQRLRPSWKPEPSAIQQDRLCLQWMSSSIYHCPRPLSCSLSRTRKKKTEPQCILGYVGHKGFICSLQVQEMKAAFVGPHLRASSNWDSLVVPNV